jgi:muramoyltetrapeptide carboxypeptidase
LREGDSVGLVAPASALGDPKDVQHAIDQLALLGLKGVPGKHVLDKNLYLAGTDEARADDFNTFVRDPNVRAIFALRGGYGTTRMLDLVDYDALRRDPKVLLGFSDLTALWNAITLRTGIVTFHGPVAAYSNFTPAVVNNIRAAVMSGAPLGTLKNNRTFTVVPGTARGRLVGGNLTLMSYLAPTPYAVPMTGNIVLIEDVHEEAYQIDGMLTMLLSAGDLQRAAGIACGIFMEPNLSEAQTPSPNMAAMLQDRLTVAGRPAVRGMQFGHIPDQWVLPLGMEATLDATAGTLTIDQAATG